MKADLRPPQYFSHTPQTPSQNPVFGNRSPNGHKFGGDFYPPDAYAPNSRANSGPSFAERAKLGLRYALKPGKLLKSAGCWTLILGIPIALSAGLGIGLIPIFMLPGIAYRLWQGIAHPGKVAQLLG